MWEYDLAHLDQVAALYRVEASARELRTAARLAVRLCSSVHGANQAATGRRSPFVSHDLRDHACVLDRADAERDYSSPITICLTAEHHPREAGS